MESGGGLTTMESQAPPPPMLSESTSSMNGKEEGFPSPSLEGGDSSVFNSQENAEASTAGDEEGTPMIESFEPPQSSAAPPTPTTTTTEFTSPPPPETSAPMEPQMMDIASPTPSHTSQDNTSVNVPATSTSMGRPSQQPSPIGEATSPGDFSAASTAPTTTTTTENVAISSPIPVSSTYQPSTVQATSTTSTTSPAIGPSIPTTVTTEPTVVAPPMQTYAGPAPAMSQGMPSGKRPHREVSVTTTIQVPMPPDQSQALSKPMVTPQQQTMPVQAQVPMQMMGQSPQLNGRMMQTPQGVVQPSRMQPANPVALAQQPPHVVMAQPIPQTQSPALQPMMPGQPGQQMPHQQPQQQVMQHMQPMQMQQQQPQAPSQQAQQQQQHMRMAQIAPQQQAATMHAAPGTMDMSHAMMQPATYNANAVQPMMPMGQMVNGMMAGQTAAPQHMGAPQAHMMMKPGQPQQQQQPQPQQMQPGAMPGQQPQQSAQTTQLRNQMIDNIFHLLQQRQPSGQENPQAESRLREMAHRLEGYLWRKSGNDPQTYADPATLKGRLKNLAMAMGNSKRPQGAQPQGQPAAPGSQQQQRVGMQPQGMMPGMAPGQPGMAPGPGYATMQTQDPQQAQQQMHQMGQPQPGQQPMQMHIGMQQQVKGPRGVPVPAVMPATTAGTMHMQNQNVATPGGGTMVMQQQPQPGGAVPAQMRRPGVQQQQPQQQQQQQAPTAQQPVQQQQRPQGTFPAYVQQQGPNQQMLAPGMPNGAAPARYMTPDMNAMYAPQDATAMQQAQQPQQQQHQVVQQQPQQQMMFQPMGQHQQQMIGQPAPPGMVGQMARPMAPAPHQQQQQQPQPQQQQPQQHQPQQPGMQPQNVQAVPGQPNQMAVAQNQRMHTPEQRQQILHQQQQRLLYLRHASKCVHVDGKCPQGFPNCRGMKELWKHISKCEEQRCQFPHCVSSRYVLLHYHKCQDRHCPVCKPVRDAIRSHRTPARPPPGMPGAPPQMGIQPQMAMQPGAAMPMAHTPQGQQPAQMQYMGAATGQPAGLVVDPKMFQQGMAPGQPMTPGAPPVQQQPPTPQQAQAAAGGKGKARGGKQAGKQANSKTPPAQQMPAPAMAANSVIAPNMATGGKKRPGQQMMEGGGQQPAKVAKTGAMMAPTMVGGAVKMDPVNMQQAQVAGGGMMMPATKMEPGKMVPGRGVGAVTAASAAQAAQMQKFEDSVSLVNSFTEGEIKEHMESLRVATYMTPAKIKLKLSPLIQNLLKHDFGWVFEEAVDPVKLNLPDYFDIIKHPMDLGQIRKKLESGTFYFELDKVKEDVILTFQNAITYNAPGQEVHKVAKEMKEIFMKQWKAMNEEIRREQEEKRRDGGACPLCACDKLLYEPPIYYCNGTCNGQRIRRNSYFYTGGRNMYHWCTNCYAEMKEEEIHIGGTVLKKSELIKKKNDEVAEEPWVECDACNRWVHQICALFNGRNNQGDAVKYYCPECTLQRRRLSGSLNPTCQPLSARSIKHTKFSEFLEQRVQKKLDECFKNLSRERGQSIQKVEKDKRNVFVRQVLATDKTFPVRERMYKRYKDQGFPSEFPCKSKCVVLFQNLDGVDVVLFAMYVYEYGHACPLPNQRRVYISYLDSVHYFRPREFRTVIYHEILVAYLAYVRQRGFHTAHIWACPPFKGDDYILHCHPVDQKVPKEDRLRKWYQNMLETAKREGIVHSITTLYEDNFTDPNLDATSLPYMEGDYWIGEAENLIKEIEDEEKEEPNNSGNRSKKMKKAKRNSGRQKADGDGEGGDKQSRDPLMTRLGEIIQAMRESFIVARLRAPEYARAMGERLQREQEMASDPNFKPDTDETLDQDGVDECEIFDTRSDFLEFCKHNHYQFDFLRRGKHTSMMVLYHLLNPDAPKFLPTCNACLKEINGSWLYRCQSCEDDYSLCPDCYREKGREHPHNLMKMPIRSKQAEGGDESMLRHKEMLRRHLELLVHSCTCKKQDCAESCRKMRELLQHVMSCPVRTQGGCRKCRRVWLLLQYHAKTCKTKDCPVPKCAQIRDALRLRQLQQLQMEDRRREAQNRTIGHRVRPEQDDDDEEQGGEASGSGGT